MKEKMREMHLVSMNACRAIVAAASVLAANSSCRTSQCDRPAKGDLGMSLIKAALDPIRVREVEIRVQWERDEDGFRELPARAWPPKQPDAMELNALQKAYQNCCYEESNKSSCHKIRFDQATCLTFNTIDPAEGLKIYKELAAEGYVDGAVASGVLLTEGLGVAVDEQEGLAFLKRAVDQGSVRTHSKLQTTISLCYCIISIEYNHRPSYQHYPLLTFLTIYRHKAIMSMARCCIWTISQTTRKLSSTSNWLQTRGIRLGSTFIDTI